ncbi:hypothetical protein D3C71_1015490 [compost metagenome]
MNQFSFSLYGSSELRSGKPSRADCLSIGRYVDHSSPRPSLAVPHNVCVTVSPKVRKPDT